MHEALIFQLALLALLASPFARQLGLFIPVWPVLASLALFSWSRLQKRDKRVGAFMLGFFALFSLGLGVYELLGLSWLTAAVFGLVLLLVFFVVLKLFIVPREAEGEVLSFSEGWAVVRVAPSLADPLKAGTYHLPSRKVKKGRRVRMAVGIFSSKPERIL